MYLYMDIFMRAYMHVYIKCEKIMRSVVGVTAILFNVTELGVTYLKVL